jgi:hypothetical protein
MQPRVWGALLIFLGSYLPLAMILAMQDVDPTVLQRPICRDLSTIAETCALPLKHPVLALGSVAVCLISLSVAIVALTRLRMGSPIVLSSIKHVPSDLMNYTLPYVVTFMSLDYGDTPKFAGFLAFLGWMFWLTFRSGQLMMNPVLTIFGWQLYEVAYTYAGGSTTERQAVALTKGDLTPNTAISHQTIQNIMIIRGKS